MFELCLARRRKTKVNRRTKQEQRANLFELCLARRKKTKVKVSLDKKIQTVNLTDGVFG